MQAETRKLDTTPFDLEKLKAGYRAVDQEVKLVEEWYYFHKVKRGPLVCKIQGDDWLRRYNERGEQPETTDSDATWRPYLFLLVQEGEV